MRAASPSTNLVQTAFQEPGARPRVSPARSAARPPQPPAAHSPPPQPPTSGCRTRAPLPPARARPARRQSARYWAQQRRAERRTQSRRLVGCACRRSETGRSAPAAAPRLELRQSLSCVWALHAATATPACGVSLGDRDSPRTPTGSGAGTAVRRLCSDLSL